MNSHFHWRKKGNYQEIERENNILRKCHKRRDLSIFICLCEYTGCSLNIVFFSKNSRKFATSPSQALGCYMLYKNYQPIGVTVHSHCVESFEGLLQRCRRGRGCSELWKTHFFLNTLYMNANVKNKKDVAWSDTWIFQTLPKKTWRVWNISFLKYTQVLKIFVCKGFIENFRAHCWILWAHLW